MNEAAAENHVNLLHYVYGMTKQWQDAENIVQELWKYVFVYFPEHNIKRRGVLFDKARKLVYDQHKKKQRRPDMNPVELDEGLMGKQSLEAYTPEEEQHLMERFFAEYPNLDLTAAQKHVLWLHARYGFTYSEVSQRTGVSVSTIGGWIILGRKRLADYINEEGA